MKLRGEGERGQQECEFQEDRAFVAACLKHGPLVEALLRARGVSPDALPDLVQETFAIAWKKRAFILNRKARAFLVATAVRIWKGNLKKQSRRQVLDARYAKEPSLTSVQSPSETHASRERRALVEILLDQLPERQALALKLVHFEKHTQTDVAARLGITQPAVATLVRKGLARLRQLLEDHDA